MASVMLIVEDGQVDIANLAIYGTGMQSRSAAEQIFAKDAQLAIREPYFKVRVDGTPGIRVDDPSDIVLGVDGGEELAGKREPGRIQDSNKAVERLPAAVARVRVIDPNKSSRQVWDEIKRIPAFERSSFNAVQKIFRQQANGDPARAGGAPGPPPEVSIGAAGNFAVASNTLEACVTRDDQALELARHGAAAMAAGCVRQQQGIRRASGSLHRPTPKARGRKHCILWRREQVATAQVRVQKPRMVVVGGKGAEGRESSFKSSSLEASLSVCALYGAWGAALVAAGCPVQALVATQCALVASTTGQQLADGSADVSKYYGVKIWALWGMGLHEWAAELLATARKACAALPDQQSAGHPWATLEPKYNVLTASGALDVRARAEQDRAQLGVGPGEVQFRTISAALAAAPPCAEVIVHPGLYTESLAIVKSVTDHGHALWASGVVATAEKCDFFSDRAATVVVMEAAGALMLAACCVHDSGQGGVLASGRGYLAMDKSVVCRSAASGVEFRTGAEGDIHGCSPFANKCDTSRGLVRSCELFNNYHMNGILIGYDHVAEVHVIDTYAP
eukprot:jgi/Mesvir1/14454/Mv11502-RA.1